ncbi:MAG: site-2 protease family protein [Cyanobacteria bacterium]|nr:site-2 protease family protein [Cyanobacteriota bacterium]
MSSNCWPQSAASPGDSRDSISCLGGIDLTEILIVLVVLITSLSVHEAAHAFAADRLGDPTARHLGRLSLNPAVHVDPIGTLLFPLIAYVTGVPLIGWAKPVPVDFRYLKHPKRDFALIAAAGPASNLVMAAIGAAVLAVVRDIAGPGNFVGGTLSDALLPLLFTFAVVNVLLAVFNMIPVPPLDGGNVLIGVLPANSAKLVEQMRPYGILILYALMLTGALNRILGPIVDYLRYLLGV